MKKHTIRVLSMLLALLMLLSSFVISVSALSWDGSSQGGGGNTTSAGANGYAIRMDGDNCIGYRFSVVDKSGANKVSKVIDVFRNTTYGNKEYTNAYKFTTKYNKKQFINNQNAGFSTSKNTTNCYKEADCGFATSLPAPSGMGTWQNNTTNLNKVLSLLNAGNIAGLKNGDKILVEPLYDVRLESIYHALTVTEIAYTVSIFSAQAATAVFQKRPKAGDLYLTIPTGIIPTSFSHRMDRDYGQVYPPLQAV